MSVSPSIRSEVVPPPSILRPLLSINWINIDDNMSDPFPRLRLLLYFLGVGINGSCNRGCDSSTRARKLNQCLFTHRTDGQSNPNTRKLSFPKSINCTPTISSVLWPCQCNNARVRNSKISISFIYIILSYQGRHNVFFSPMVHAYNIRIKSLS